MYQPRGNISAAKTLASTSVSSPMRTTFSPCPASSSSPGLVPGPSTSAGEPEVKKKNKKLSKEVRRRKREEEVFKGIYGPKDSHIQMISPAVMQLIQKDRAREYQQKNMRLSSSSLAKDIKEEPISPVTKASTSVEGKVPSWLSPGSVWGNGYRINPSRRSLEKEFPTIGETPKKEAEDDGWETDNEVSPENVSKRSVGVQAPEEIPKTPENSYSKSLLGTPPPGILQLPSPLSVLESATPVSNKKPSKKPMVVSLEALIQSKTPNKVSRKSLPLKTLYSSKETVGKTGMQRAGNILDSSGLVLMHRGKLRETPKLKKPSKLKQSILRTRALRRVKLEKLFANCLTLENTGDSTDWEVTEDALVLEELDETLNDTTGSLNESDTTLELKFSEDSSIVESKESEPNVNPNCQSVSDVTPMVAKSEKLSVSPKRKQVLVSEPVLEEPNIFRKLMEEAERKPDPPIEAVQTPDPLPCTPPEVIQSIKTQLHSRKCRSYCDMKPSKELHGHVIALLNELHRFQDRLYHSDPIKFKTKKKYVHGIKDVNSFLNLGKLKMIILAPDIEPNDGKGGLDDKISNLIHAAKESNVPCVFSGHRYILGKQLKVKGPVSAIGILDKQGAEDLFSKVLEESEKLKDIYAKDFEVKLANYMENTKISPHLIDDKSHPLSQ